MRKYLMTLAAVLCCATTLVLSSCNAVDDIPVKNSDTDQLADYTIIYYANGGGNVDKCILPMINDFYNAKAESYKYVNVVVQYKYSTAENMKKQSLFEEDFCDEWGGKTVRWAIDPQKNMATQMGDPGNIYGADNADLACPDSLTNLINWAAKNYPAKNYMLILNDHGGGYTPDDELPEQASATRGLLYDDGNKINNRDKHFTAKSLKRAITNANVRLQTIYMLACLMNNLEYQFELKDLCDYVIASTYSMPATGGALGLLPEALSMYYNDIEWVLSTYCKIDVETWEDEIDPNEPFYTDLTVTRTANLDKLGEMMREFTDRLCNTYTNGTEKQKQLIDSCTAHAVKVEACRPSYDVAKYMSSIINALPEVYDDEFYLKMAETFNSCLLAQNYSSYLTNHDYMVDYSVMLGVEGTYLYIISADDGYTPVSFKACHPDGTSDYYSLTPNDDGTSYTAEFIRDLAPWGSTLDNTYGQLEFDRIVGWSRWLKLNRQQPNLACPSAMNLNLPEPNK